MLEIAKTTPKHQYTFFVFFWIVVFLLHFGGGVGVVLLPSHGVTSRLGPFVTVAAAAVAAADAVAATAAAAAAAACNGLKAARQSSLDLWETPAVPAYRKYAELYFYSADFSNVP